MGYVDSKEHIHSFDGWLITVETSKLNKKIFKLLTINFLIKILAYDLFNPFLNSRKGVLVSPTGSYDFVTRLLFKGRNKMKINSR